MKLKHFYSSKDNIFFGPSPEFMGAILMILWGYRAVLRAMMKEKGIFEKTNLT